MPPKVVEVEARGTVECFHAEEGWGAIISDAMEGNALVHFSMIETSGFRALRAGQHVEFRFVADRGQDGCTHQATWVRPL
jgi:CspA family cold shock protein